MERRKIPAGFPAIPSLLQPKILLTVEPERLLQRAAGFWTQHSDLSMQPAAEIPRWVFPRSQVLHAIHLLSSAKFRQMRVTEEVKTLHLKNTHCSRTPDSQPFSWVFNKHWISLGSKNNTTPERTCIYLEGVCHTHCHFVARQSKSQCVCTCCGIFHTNKNFLKDTKQYFPLWYLSYHTLWTTTKKMNLISFFKIHHENESQLCSSSKPRTQHCSKTSQNLSCHKLLMYLPLIFTIPKTPTPIYTNWSLKTSNFITRLSDQTKHLETPGFVPWAVEYSPPQLNSTEEVNAQYVRKQPFQNYSTQTFTVRERIYHTWSKPPTA